MSAPRRLRIAVCTALERVQWGPWNEPSLVEPLNVVAGVQQAGGLPLLVPPDAELVRNPDEVLDLVDGILLAGGADVDAAQWGGKPHPLDHVVPEQDAFEIALSRRALERNLPLFGICRGIQLLNVALGGTLHSNLPYQVGHQAHRRVSGTFRGADHQVDLQPGSLIAGVIGEPRTMVKSHHRQGIDRLGDGLVPTARCSLDGLVEAVEIPGRRFALAVQWHPEADLHSREMAAFLEACAP